MKTFNTLLTTGVALMFALPLSAQASEAQAQKGGCMACHAKDKKLVGPSFSDIAKKYKGQGDAAGKLATKVRKGGSGVWGPVPMVPSGLDKIGDADLQDVIAWILKQ